MSYGQGLGFRPLTAHYTPPDDGVPKYRVMYHLGIRSIVDPAGRPMTPEEVVGLLNSPIDTGVTNTERATR